MNNDKFEAVAGEERCKQYGTYMQEKGQARIEKYTYDDGQDGKGNDVYAEGLGLERQLGQTDHGHDHKQ